MPTVPPGTSVCLSRVSLYQSEEVCCLQVNDAAVSLRLVLFVSKGQRIYTQITVQTGWGEGREERGAVLADGHLVRGPH